MKRTLKMLKPTRWLIAAALLVTFMETPVVFAVTVTESTRTVQSRNFIVKWSSADQEAILSVQWHSGGNPASASNLTATFNVGGCPAPFAPEYWGNSWADGDPQDGNEVLVGLGTITPPEETAWAPVFGRKGVGMHSRSTDCFPPFVAAQVPVRTRYRFFDHGPRANVIKLDREFDFKDQPFSSAFRPYMPRLSLTFGLGFDEVKYPTTGGALATVSVDLCPFGCTQSDWDPAQGWFAIHSPTTGKGVIVKRAPNGIMPQLWIDGDGASFTNASSFLLLPPTEGFTEEVTERMVLCFYDSTIWPTADQQALKLPAGCSVTPEFPPIVNDFVAFEPIPSTYRFITDTTGCPAGFVGIFSFDATLTNISDSNLANLHIAVAELTDGNVLLTEDGLLGVGEHFSVPQRDDFTDALLSPGELVDVPFAVCLQERQPFRLFVDVLGTVLTPMRVGISERSGSDSH